MLREHLALYVEKGFAIQVKHLSHPVFYGITESGPQNSYVHIWAYADAADRASKRAALESDPEWLAYRKLSAEAGFMATQENRLLTIPGFFKPAEAAAAFAHFAR
jgi:hypothetical protein